MKILFISSGNSRLGISPIVKAQGESLKYSGLELEYYTVKGKGILGYSKSIFTLRKFLKTNSFDIVHSHFFLSSIVATLSNPKNLIVSLMGSDVYKSSIWNFFIKLFHKRWKATIVKSERMKDILRLDDLYLIPNGVDFKKFYPIDKKTARERLGWNKTKYILFASNPHRPEKNYTLAKKSVEILNNEDTELIILQDIPHELIVYYLNAVDVLLMTSKYEGSPNIIKEAMACNCPIVTTDVGDIKDVVGTTEGCYIVSFESRNIAEKLKLALQFNKRTNGCEKIKHLSSGLVADQIVEIYKTVLKQ